MSDPVSRRLEAAALHARLGRLGVNLAVLALLPLGLLLAGRLLPTRDLPPKERRAASVLEPCPLGFVKEVLDGDSMRLDNGVEVRLKGIDAPELGRPFSNEATHALRGLVLARKVRLEYEAREIADRYGRLLAFVSTEECPCVSEALVRSGLAWIYRQRPGTSRHERLLQAQREALSSGRGLWSVSNLHKGVYVGSRSSRVFHLRDCIHLRKGLKKKESFERLYDAFWQGYSPCRSCVCMRRPLEGF
jgi:endonuclease YncB( thermonuclease family)